jgi:hypothetical protein
MEFSPRREAHEPTTTPDPEVARIPGCSAADHAGIRLLVN